MGDVAKLVARSLEILKGCDIGKVVSEDDLLNEGQRIADAIVLLQDAIDKLCEGSK